jgi:hypothetical protein
MERVLLQVQGILKCVFHSGFGFKVNK